MTWTDQQIRYFWTNKQREFISGSKDVMTSWTDQLTGYFSTNKQREFISGSKDVMTSWTDQQIVFFWTNKQKEFISGSKDVMTSWTDQLTGYFSTNKQREFISGSKDVMTWIDHQKPESVAYGTLTSHASHYRVYKRLHQSGYILWTLPVICFLASKDIKQNVWHGRPTPSGLSLICQADVWGHYASQSSYPLDNSLLIVPILHKPHSVSDYI